MAYAEGQMDGSYDWRVGLNMYLVSQNQGGNFSTFYWEVSIQNPARQGSWFSDNGTWWCSAGGSGTWNWPSSMAGSPGKVIGSGYVNAGHDAAGNRPGFSTTATASAPHPSIGSGSVELWVDAPRIPKRPSPPPFNVDQVGTTGFRVVVSAPADDGGSPIDAYLIRISSNPQADTPGSYTDYPGGGTRTFTNMTPGTRYYVTVYAHNGSVDNNGYSTYQASKAVDTLAGVYVSDGSTWVPQPLQVSTGSEWSSLVPSVSTGSAWVQPS